MLVDLGDEIGRACPHLLGTVPLRLGEIAPGHSMIVEAQEPPFVLLPNPPQQQIPAHQTFRLLANGSGLVRRRKRPPQVLRRRLPLRPLTQLRQRIRRHRHLQQLHLPVGPAPVFLSRHNILTPIPVRRRKHDCIQRAESQGSLIIRLQRHRRCLTHVQT